jgi:anaerobic magnesium-protoporphyrin IX monomethyl ester cyclase
MTHDILLVNTRIEHFGSIQGDITIGLNLLSAFLRRHSRTVKILRGFAREVVPRLERLLEEGTVRSVGFYCDHENEAFVGDLCRQTKDRWPLLPIFIGGPQAECLDAAFLAGSRCDAVVRGEAEETLLELITGYLGGTRSLADIDGITFLAGDGSPAGQLVRQPARPPLADLDALPWPDFGEEGRDEPFVVLPVLTGRGCPNRCTFCQEGGLQRQVRFRRVEAVLDEISWHLDRNPGCTSVFFLDSTFTIDPRRVERFCEGMARLRRERDFVWMCSGHVRDFDRHPHLLGQMVAAGMARLVLGIESGSNDVLATYRKNTTTAMMERVLAACAAANVPQVTGNIILGGPLAGPETVAADLQLIRNLLAAAPGRFSPSSNFFVPYGATAITKDPEAFGLRILRDRQLHALEDIPQTETAATSWLDLFEVRREFNQRVVESMIDLYAGGRISEETMLAHYRLGFRYNLASVWIINVLSRDPIAHQWFTDRAAGHLFPSREFSADRLPTARPRRVFSLSETLSWSGDTPMIGDRPLSPTELDLLRRCTGERRLDDILIECQQTWRGPGESAAGFQARARQMIGDFEDRRWIGFRPDDTAGEVVRPDMVS